LQTVKESFFGDCELHVLDWKGLIY